MCYLNELRGFGVEEFRGQQINLDGGWGVTEYALLGTLIGVPQWGVHLHEPVASSPTCIVCFLGTPVGSREEPVVC